MMNEKDRKLLLELMKESRMSLSDLARHCGMSRQGVFARIRSLRSQGIIRNFTVNIDPRKLGLAVKAYLLIEAEPVKEFRDEADEIVKKYPQVTQIHHLFGRFDVLLEVVARDTEELTNLVAKIHELKMVRKTETMIVYRTVKSEQEHPIENVLTT